jgi:3-oxoacyl-[acyl-carrier protein] reductase
LRYPSFKKKIISNLTPEILKEHAKQLEGCPGKVYAYKCDVSNPASITEAFKYVVDKFGTFHILVNNAGVAK